MVKGIIESVSIMEKKVAKAMPAVDESETCRSAFAPDPAFQIFDERGNACVLCVCVVAGASHGSWSLQTRRRVGLNVLFG